MTNLTQIADTISKDFRKAVEAALMADAAQVESILQDINAAYKAQADGLVEVADKEKQIGLLMKETLEMREKIDNEFYNAMKKFRHDMGAMRGSKLSAPKLKAIEGTGK
jgi:hypothetical protein